ncbi:type II secretion system protein GspD [Poseidonibacter ostreae]|uniref:Type II/III secretion system secretin-like domain-containing protein n=1 Tax=Poseidonibacter ostreae TaxID=2654171 RepID=A0A6L4WZ90_9BACT|nr:hypothetical protein [Poseidonibacter ostreae]KAB7891324.1 hypothetical protein GBG19_00375 [Poseidonibacter ostreae]
MKYKLFGKMFAGSLIAVAILSGCSTKVQQEGSTTLQKVADIEIEDSSQMRNLDKKSVHIRKKDIYLSSKIKLSQALKNLGKVDSRTYILQDKDIEIGGYDNLKFTDFFELNKILETVYSVEMRITQNNLDATLPKIVKLYPKVKTTILDELQINQNGLLVPNNLLSKISQYTNGWKFTYKNDLKADLAKNDYSHFKGSLREFLTYFADLNDYFLDYNYKTKTISLSKYKSKMFRLKGNKEKIVYSNNVSMDLESSDSSSSGESSGTGIKIEDTYDLVKTLKASLTSIIPEQTDKEYFNVISESGYIVVSTTASKMLKIEELITSINADSFKNIFIKVTLLKTKLNNAHQRGVNWGYIKQSLDSVGNVVSSTVGAIAGNLADTTSTISSDTFLKFRGSNGVSAVIKALNEFGDTGISYQLSSMTTNNIPAMINLANIQDYIYQTVIDSSGDTATVTATQSEVQGGKFLYIKPSAYDDEIRVSLTILDRTINPFVKNEFGENQFLQSKNIDKRTMNHNIVLRNGEKIIIGGFMEKILNKEYSGLGNNGGSIANELLGYKTKEYNSEEIALMLEIVEL